MRKKILSLLLVIVMCLGTFSVIAFADEIIGEDTRTPISEVRIDRYTLPTVGEAGDYRYSVPSDANYHIQDANKVVWYKTKTYPDVESLEIAWDEWSGVSTNLKPFVYKSGYYYTFSAWVVPNSGYKFDENTRYYVDDKEVCSNYTEGISDGHLAIYKTYKPIDLTFSKASLTAGTTAKATINKKGTVSYTSLNKNIATISSTGTITALTKGTATIRAKVGDTTFYKAINVTTNPKLSKSKVTVKKGKTTTISITGKAKYVSNKYVNTTTARITSSASATKLTIKGLKRGTTTLKVRVNGKYLSFKVTVR